ncbi:hypothetical protein CALCODRAFT_517258 [Calocera cornea HHB12733]|uniref:F-box domain-containing protein n=1 Tax=Calocera cornea HHB12733 TaxID=1353952 RepID=A0A165G911_9BASI|nr:hypothetical protein CALCODRAFT_517258 [Calocera cornea HHB12733]
MQIDKKARFDAELQHASSSRADLIPGTSVMDIPELFQLVLSFLSSAADLVAMACVAKRYSDAALSLIWRTPNFQGDPLLQMAHLFPDGTCDILVDGKDTSYRISAEFFLRFDYYANFIRHIHLWKAPPERFIAGILSASRPGVWLFPHLISIHIGCDGDTLHAAGPYLTPSLKELKINHWEPENLPVVASSSRTTAILLQIFELPDLEVLDLMDTRYPDYEHNTELVDALIEMIPQLVSFSACDFTTVKRVYDALSKSRKLRSLFLDLGQEREPQLHHELDTLIKLTRQNFPALQDLSILCAGPEASRFLRQVNRELHCVDLRIEGDLVVEGLQELVQSVTNSTSSLRTFKCGSSEPADDPGERRLIDALKPLGAMTSLRHLYIAMSFTGTQMLSDADIDTLFAAWPHMQTFTLESDPGAERPVLTEDEPMGFALTLTAIQQIQHYAPSLKELHLSYVDLSHIPDIPKPVFTESFDTVEILFTRSHAHNRRAIRGFINKLWRRVTLDFEACCLMTLPHSD